MPPDSRDPSGSYAAALRHPVVRALLGAKSISSVGDFVGLGALLLIAHERAGGVALGPSLLFGAQALPALLLGTVLSGYVRRLPRRRALVAANLVAAVVVLLPVLVGGFPIVLATAFALGATRATVGPLMSSITAGDVPDQFKGRAIALFSTSFQLAQVAGLIVGASLGVGGWASVALVADAVSFVVAALFCRRLPDWSSEQAALPRPPATAGFAVIRDHPVARAVIPVAWAVMLLGALPEALSVHLTSGGWVAPSMAGAAAVTAVGGFALGNRDWLDRPRSIARIAWAGPAGLVVLAASQLDGVGGPAVLAGTMVMGGAGIATVGVQAAIARTVRPEQAAQLAATMVASIIVLEGVGTFAAGALVDAIGAAPGLLALAAAGAVGQIACRPRLLADQDYLRLVAAQADRRP